MAMSLTSRWGEGWRCRGGDRGVQEASSGCALANLGPGEQLLMTRFLVDECWSGWWFGHVWNHGLLWLSIQLGMSSSQLTNSYFSTCLTFHSVENNHHILGISSSQLTKSIIFKRGRVQPPSSSTGWFNVDSEKFGLGWCSALVGSWLETCWKAGKNHQNTMFFSCEPPQLNCGNRRVFLGTDISFQKFYTHDASHGTFPNSDTPLKGRVIAVCIHNFL